MDPEINKELESKIDRRTFMFGGFGLLGIADLVGVSLPNLQARLEAIPLSRKFVKSLPQMLELALVPGISVASISRGRISWAGQFGVKSLETKEKVTPGTVFPVGSLGKPVFGYAVMQLVEEGLLDLDRPLASYVPGDLVKDEPRTKQVTTRHVLSHTSGLQNWRFQAGDSLQFAFSPGTRFSYSGEGFHYLQRAVENITNTGLEKLMRERVFGPLGMDSSSYVWLPGYEKNMVATHNSRGNVSVELGVHHIPRLQKLAAEWKKPLDEWRFEDMQKAMPIIENQFPALPAFMDINAAGSLRTTVGDYAKFLLALLEPRKGHGYLKPDTIQEVLMPQIQINIPIAWGLGWGLEFDAGRSQFWHWAEGLNFRSFVIADREAKTGVIVFTNGRNGRKVWERIVAEVTGRDHPLFLWL